MQLVGVTLLDVVVQARIVPDTAQSCCEAAPAFPLVWGRYGLELISLTSTFSRSSSKGVEVREMIYFLQPPPPAKQEPMFGRMAHSTLNREAARRSAATEFSEAYV